MTNPNITRTHDIQARAALLTAAILKIVCRALHDWLRGYGAPSNFGNVAGEIEALLTAELERRDEELLAERVHEAQFDFQREQQS